MAVAGLSDNDSRRIEMNSGGSDLSVDTREKVLQVRINRPEKRNALSRATLKEIGNVFNHHKSNDSILVAVLTGAGDRSFAAGGDLKDLDSVRTRELTVGMVNTGRTALDAIRNFCVPVVAAINGTALGGGAELAMACDYRVADEAAKIGFVQGKLNITTAWGGGADLMERIGSAPALKLLAGCRILDAKAALELGVIDACCDRGQSLDDCVEDFVSPFLERSTTVMRGYKSLRNQARNEFVQSLNELETNNFIESWLHDEHWQAAGNILKKS